MNRTGRYISDKKNILSIYFTAGYPAKGDTKETILSLQTAGADMIEIGLPFSDPLADGPVIQRSSTQAIKNGFTLTDLFGDLKAIHLQIKIPLVLMGYFNTVLAFGVENFLKQCQVLQIDTVILPDLPPDVYHSNYSDMFKRYGVSPVFLITPQTTESRIELINGLSNAFVYAVAQNSITGVNKKFADRQVYFKKIKETHLRVPVLIGFGVSDRKAYRQACEYAHGAIIGSAFIQAIEKTKTLNETIRNFIHSIKHAS